MATPQPAFTVQACLFRNAVAVRLVGHEDFQSYFEVTPTTTVAPCASTSICPGLYYGVGTDKSDVVRTYYFSSGEERDGFVTQLTEALKTTVSECPELHNLVSQHVAYHKKGTPASEILETLVIIKIVDLGS